MLNYSLISLAVAIAANALDFDHVAGWAATIAAILFFLFLVRFVAALFRGKKT